MSVSVHRWWDQVSDAEDHKGEFSLDLYEAAASISIPDENFLTEAFAQSEEKGS